MGKGRGKGRGRTAGAKDRLPRKRRNATSDELANKAAKKALKRQKGQADSEAAKQRFVSSIPSAPSGGAADGRAATSRGDLGSENYVSEMQGTRVVSRGENGPRSQSHGQMTLEQMNASRQLASIFNGGANSSVQMGSAGGNRDDTVHRDEGGSHVQDEGGRHDAAGGDAGPDPGDGENQHSHAKDGNCHSLSVSELPQRPGQDDSRQASPSSRDAPAPSPSPDGDIQADLDDDRDMPEQESGVMGTYLRAVFDRLKAETRRNSGGSVGSLQENWLLKLLEEWDWKISEKDAALMCKKLGLVYGEPSYYRSIHVWLPDLRWGHESMPPCVNCKHSNSVQVHGWRDNHCGRRVYATDTHYFVISRRYKCSKCECVAKEEKRKEEQAKQKAKDVAERVGLVVQDDAAMEDASAEPDDLSWDEDDDADSHLGGSGPPRTRRTQFTFMATDLRSIQRLPYGHGDEFPAFLTHRAAVDFKVIDWMRPLCDRGLRPEALSDIMLEHSAKRYTKDYIKREHKISEDRHSVDFNRRLSSSKMFSSFGDKEQYAGKVPTGKYLSRVYRLHSRLLSEFLAKEVCVCARVCP